MYRCWAPDYEDEGGAETQVYFADDPGPYANVIELVANSYRDWLDRSYSGSGFDGRIVFIRDCDTREVHAREISVAMIPEIVIHAVDTWQKKHVAELLADLKDDADQAEEVESEEPEGGAA